MSFSLMCSRLVYGACPQDGYMPAWEQVTRQNFYSSVYYPYIPLLSIYFLDRTVTDISYSGPFSVVVNDGGATRKFEDLTWVSQMNTTVLTNPSNFWNATHAEKPQTFLLSQQEFMASIGAKNGYVDSKPVLISLIGEGWWS